MDQSPLVTNDAIVLGMLMVILGLVFWTSSRPTGFWKKFYSVVPSLLLCYFVPSLLSTAGLISGDESNLYWVSSRYLLPTSLVLLTLSVDLKGIMRLGPKAVISGILVFWIVVVSSVYFVTSKDVFFAVAVLAGLGLGGIQAASRALMSDLIPRGKEAEFFGFYAFCGKSSSVIGPIMFGEISNALAGNQRVAILSITVLFILGLALLRRVRAPSANKEI